MKSFANAALGWAAVIAVVLLLTYLAGSDPALTYGR